jgi:hypothetical protein
MRTHLAPVACLLALAGVSFMLSLTQGQESAAPAPVAPVIKAAPGPSPVTVPPAALHRTAAPASPRQGPDLESMAPLPAQMYRSTQRAAGWLAERNSIDGRFEQDLSPALNVPVGGDHAIREAGAAFALARAARYLKNTHQAARATQAILGVLEDTVVDPKATQIRHTALPSSVVNRLGSAALLVLAVHELPAPGKDLLDKAEQLCNYIRAQQQADGSLLLGEAGSDVGGLNSHAGQALYALARSQKHRPARWKMEVLRKALPCYLKEWEGQKDRDLVCWQTSAWTEAYLQTGDKVFAEAVFTMNDWLCGLQYAKIDPYHPRRLGGFMACSAGKIGEEEPDIDSALCALSLAEACRVTRQAPDLARHKKYTATLELCLQFLVTLQYSEGDTQHFADWYRPRLIGGFHVSHTDGTLRIEHTQSALAALVQYLEQVARVP